MKFRLIFNINYLFYFDVYFYILAPIIPNIRSKIAIFFWYYFVVYSRVINMKNKRAMRDILISSTVLGYSTLFY